MGSKDLVRCLEHLSRIGGHAVVEGGCIADSLVRRVARDGWYDLIVRIITGVAVCNNAGVAVWIILGAVVWSISGVTVWSINGVAVWIILGAAEWIILGVAEWIIRRAAEWIILGAAEWIIMGVAATGSLALSIHPPRG